MPLSVGCIIDSIESCTSVKTESRLAAICEGGIDTLLPLLLKTVRSLSFFCTMDPRIESVGSRDCILDRPVAPRLIDIFCYMIVGCCRLSTFRFASMRDIRQHLDIMLDSLPFKSPIDESVGLGS